MVEGARLESVYRSKAYRGFESRPLRRKERSCICKAFFIFLNRFFDTNPIFFVKRKSQHSIKLQSKN